MKDEVLKLALVAFEEINKLSVGENAICLPAEIDTAMDACRQALAQPEQEPIGTVKELFTQAAWERLDLRGSTQVYITPPHRNPLTDEEIDKITEQLDETTIGWSTHEFARAIEAKLKEKNNG